MFSRSAMVYDAIYAFKDYAEEAALVTAHIRQSCPEARTLLDVACGTGQHLGHLKTAFEAEGMDLESGLLAVARSHHPELTFHQADMTAFELGRRYDAITCLFSAVGYVVTPERLTLAIRSMAAHLNPGGVLVIEPWLHPEAFKTGTVHANFVNRPELKIARMTVSELEGAVSVLHFHYLVGTPEGVEHYTERHALGLFADEAYRAAFTDAGLAVHHDAHGLNGRGLYIGVKLA